MCPFKVTLCRLLSKSAYKVDFLSNKCILYKRFLLYRICIGIISKKQRRMYLDSCKISHLIQFGN